MAQAQTQERKPFTMPIIWIFGGPGSGKGTQCEKIVQKYGFTHLSIGEILRAEVASGSAKGKELDAIMKTGKLVSNEIVLEVLQQTICKHIDNAKGFLIDGYPREKSQGETFEQQIGPVDLIIYFECKDETLAARVKGRAAAATEKRADEGAIQTRIKTFHQESDAILAQYSHKVTRVNAEGTVDEIFCEVVCAIDCMLERRDQDKDVCI